jgi:hypothetical protein
MLKRFLTGAVLALAAGLATSAAAETPGGVHTITFNGATTFTCRPGTVSSGGLDFTGGWMGCFYSPSDPADFPIPLTSSVMAIGFAPVTMDLRSGGVFDLLSLDLAAGVWTEVGDHTEVTGNEHGGGTFSADLALNSPFTTYDLNWTNLDSVSFSTPIPGNAYIAYDNVTVRGLMVPEPGEWLLLVGGLLASGYMLRRARQLATAEI